VDVLEKLLLYVVQNMFFDVQQPLWILCLLVMYRFVIAGLIKQHTVVNFRACTTILRFSTCVKNRFQWTVWK
jgi:hypothetical protein